MRIWNEPSKEKEAIFRLFETDHCIELRLVNGLGEKVDCGDVMAINKHTGKFHRIGSVNPNYGLSLESDGRIEEE